MLMVSVARPTLVPDNTGTFASSSQRSRWWDREHRGPAGAGAVHPVGRCTEELTALGNLQCHRLSEGARIQGRAQRIP